ncbi:MAG: hypothetical protein JST35_12350 [Armatimonadetes bacterium]|nr:hypothetical protein [Armatimonadota bacterium]
MPTTLQRIVVTSQLGSTEITTPPAGIVANFNGRKGDFVTLDATGKVTSAANSNAQVGATVRLALLNQAVATGTPAGTPVSIEKIDENTIIELPATQGNAAVANPATTIPAIVGTQVALRRTSTGTYTADLAATTGPHLEVIGIGTRYSMTEPFSTVLVKVLPGARLL